MNAYNVSWQNIEQPNLIKIQISGWPKWTIPEILFGGFLLLSSWILSSNWYHEISALEKILIQMGNLMHKEGIHTLALRFAAYFFPPSSGRKRLSLAFLLQVSSPLSLGSEDLKLFLRYVVVLFVLSWHSSGTGCTTLPVLQSDCSQCAAEFCTESSTFRFLKDSVWTRNWYTGFHCGLQW